MILTHTNVITRMYLSSSLSYNDVSSNGIKSAGAQAFSEMLKVNKTLTELVLSNNDIKAEGAAALADALKTNEIVRVLDVSGNSLDRFSKDELTKHKPPQLTLNM